MGASYCSLIPSAFNTKVESERNAFTTIYKRVDSLFSIYSWKKDFIVLNLNHY